MEKRQILQMLKNTGETPALLDIKIHHH